eukprot:SAG31_NODE_2_length_46263_cov_45.908043_22_plen_121_part_00
MSSAVLLFSCAQRWTQENIIKSEQIFWKLALQFHPTVVLLCNGSVLFLLIVAAGMGYVWTYDLQSRPQDRDLDSVPIAPILSRGSTTGSCVPGHEYESLDGAETDAPKCKRCDSILIVLA